MEHSAGDPLISAPHPERKKCGGGTLVVFVWADGVQSTPYWFSQCIMRESVGEVVGTNDWPGLARPSTQLLLDLVLNRVV